MDDQRSCSARQAGLPAAHTAVWEARKAIRSSWCRASAMVLYGQSDSARQSLLDWIQPLLYHCVPDISDSLIPYICFVSNNFLPAHLDIRNMQGKADCCVLLLLDLGCSHLWALLTW